MKDKPCKKCKKEKIDSRINKSGLCHSCYGKKYREENKKQLVAYAKKYGKKYYQENREAQLKRNDKYYAKNQEEILIDKRLHYDMNTEELRKYSKKQYENNKAKRNEQNKEYRSERYKQDEAYRNRVKLGTALNYVIRNYIKTGKIANPMRKYCIDWEGIIKRLSPIPKDRNKYQVDHIIPLYKFDLTNWEQIQIAFAPENHRWLLAKDNMGRSKLKRKRLSLV